MNRVTAQKQQILDAFKPGYHPTAEELLQKLRKSDPNFSRATVYRNLAYFCEEGKLVKLNFLGGPDRYEMVGEPHYHLVCEKCGRIEDVMTKPIATPSTLMGYQVTGHTLTFFGLCPKCQQKAKK